MALSVRSNYNNFKINENLNSQYLSENNSEIDHYLIETLAVGSNIRLEGSPFIFKSLPLLLQHYCLNGCVNILNVIFLNIYC